MAKTNINVPDKQLLQIANRIKLVNNKLIEDGRVPHAGQKKIVSAVFEKGYRRILIVAGRSWGKSLITMYIAARFLCLPKKSFFIIGPTRKQQKEIMWETGDGLKTFFPKALNAHPLETEQRLELPWNSFVKIDGSENHQAFRGVPYDGMILDEAQMMDWRFYDAAYPNLSKRNGILIVIGTLELDLKNPFMQLWEEAKRDKDWLVLNAPSWENPHMVEWLKKEKPKYIARGDEAQWMREYEAVYVTGGKRAVLPMFDPKVHVHPHEAIVARANAHWQNLHHWTAFDPGTKSVFGGLFSSINRDTGDVYIYDEIYEQDPRLTTPRLIFTRGLGIEAEHYHKGCEISRVYDEAAAWFGTCVAVEFQTGLIPTQKASRDKLDDIGIIKDALLAGKLHISERCKNLIQEMSSWSTDDNGKIIDKNDHLLDCLRYLFRMSGYSILPQYDDLANNEFISAPRTTNLESLAPVVDTLVDTSFDTDIWL